MTSEHLDLFREVGRMLWEAGLVSSRGGNLSIRLPDGGIVITRTGAMLGRLSESDLVTVAPDGSADGAQTGALTGEPSMDTALHRAAYDATDAAAVLHAHPRHAIALSLDADVIEPVDAEGQLRLGAVPVVEAEAIPQALRDAPIAVARGHGSYARGDDLWQALQWTTVVEESAHVLWLTR
ncbi:MAG: class II aldolase/adducin family protein [Dehalococcoidia bacterium]